MQIVKSSLTSYMQKCRKLWSTLHRKNVENVQYITPQKCRKLYSTLHRKNAEICTVHYTVKKNLRRQNTQDNDRNRGNGSNRSQLLNSHGQSFEKVRRASCFTSFLNLSACLVGI